VVSLCFALYRNNYILWCYKLIRLAPEIIFKLFEIPGKPSWTRIFHVKYEIKWHWWNNGQRNCNPFAVNSAECLHKIIFYVTAYLDLRCVFNFKIYILKAKKTMCDFRRQYPTRFGGNKPLPWRILWPAQR